jgi:hypothetical protein
VRNGPARSRDLGASGAETAFNQQQTLAPVAEHRGARHGSQAGEPLLEQSARVARAEPLGRGSGAMARGSALCIISSNSLVAARSAPAYQRGSRRLTEGAFVLTASIYAATWFPVFLGQSLGDLAQRFWWTPKG